MRIQKLALLLLWGELARRGAWAYATSSLHQPRKGMSAPDQSRPKEAANNNGFHQAKADLEHLQKESGPIAASFVPSDFNPWIKNCHVQTIASYFLRDTCSYVPRGRALETAVTGVLAILQRRRSKKPVIASPVLESNGIASSINDLGEQAEQLFFWDHRERIETPDGDWFHADTKFVSIDAPTVIIMHGLESNSMSRVTIGMARAFKDLGLNCVCLNFRGCSGTPNDVIGGYHLGFTDDLKQYLVLHQERYPGNDVFITGFSLGANVALKCLGELGAAAVREFRIRGAAVLCAPLDQELNARALARPGINRVIYTDNLLQSLKRRAQYQLDRFCQSDPTTDRFDFLRGMAAQTITEFDDAFIAPIYNFRDCWDYYRQTSSVHFLERIAVPTLILNAKDDPFFDPEVWPVEKTTSGGGPAPIQMVRTDYGGHVGFCFHQVEDTHDARLTCSQQEGWQAPSWAFAELARFVQHVRTFDTPTQQ